MITIAQENKVRKLVSEGMTNAEISSRVGISRATVRSIRSMDGLISQLSDEEKAEILRLAKVRTPAGAIELQTKIPKKAVLAMRRHYYLHRRSSGEKEPCKCPTCGAIMFPENAPAQSSESKFSIDALTIEDAKALYKIVGEVSELGRLRLITHSLFYYLSQRAERTMEKINGKKNETHTT